MKCGGASISGHPDEQRQKCNLHLGMRQRALLLVAGLLTFYSRVNIPVKLEHSICHIICTVRAPRNIFVAGLRAIVLLDVAPEKKLNGQSVLGQLLGMCTSRRSFL